VRLGERMAWSATSLGASTSVRAASGVGTPVTHTAPGLSPRLVASPASVGRRETQSLRLTLVQPATRA
jgi:hypothetical protein